MPHEKDVIKRRVKSFATTVTRSKRGITFPGKYVRVKFKEN